MEISKHAQGRIKERLGISKKAQPRLVEKMLEKGVSHSEATGNLSDWITTRLLNNSPKGSKGIVFNNHLWILNHNTVITVLSVPNSLQKAVKNLLDKRNK